ncbi:MAG: hypothetical protein DMG08_15840 [Acidobacteria bacterium]|nr:MAG: hypothetical protein DMG08_15840 [Acidobacteriota bacterium]
MSNERKSQWPLSCNSWNSWPAKRHEFHELTRIKFSTASEEFTAAGFFQLSFTAKALRGKGVAKAPGYS